MDLERSDGVIRIRTEQLEFEVVPGCLQMRLASRRAALALVGFAPRAGAAARSLAPTRALADDWRPVETPCGPAMRLALRSACEHPALELELAVELADDWPGLVLEVALACVSDAAPALEWIDACAWERARGGAMELPGERSAWRFLRLGYQSWSPAAWLPLAGADARGRLALFRRVHFGPRTPLPRRGLHVSDFASELRAPGAPGFALGFLTHRSWLTHVALEHRGGEPAELRARCALEPRAPSPRGRVEAERFWLGLLGAREDGLAQWAGRCGAEQRAPVPARVAAGWCSWYRFFTRVRAQDVQRNLAALSAFAGQFEVLQIDDGWQAAVGDWLEFGAEFPDGVEPLARAIRSAGLRAGLWLAPFLVSRRARTAREHPEWLLRDARGRPLIANYNPGWPGRICYALDVTHRDARAWLASVFERLRSWGFDYLKLDFLYAALLPGRRSDPEVAPVAAYRSLLAELRRAAGPDAFFLGCGAPLGPSVGLFEAMRIGPDVAPAWSNPRDDFVIGLGAAPSAENSIRNALARASLHQRLWLNDPDCVLVRDRHTRLDATEVRTLAAVVALSGGLVLASDDLPELPEERARLLRRLLPPLQRPPLVVAGDAAVPDLLAQRFSDGSVLALRVNLGRSARELVLDPAAFGFEGAVHAYDVWEERYLGSFDGPIRSRPIPPHGSRLLRLVAASRRPAVLGSSLHLAAGGIEVARVDSATPEGTRLQLRLPGPRRGSLVVLPAAGAPLTVAVDFTGELELCVRQARGLEESRGMSDG